MKNKAMALALSLALTVGLCPGMALAANGSAGGELAGAQTTSTLSTQATVSELVKAASEKVAALPSAKNVKLTDNKKVAAAFRALYKVVKADDLADITDDEKAQYVSDYETFEPVMKALDSLIKSETSKTKKMQVKSVKVTAGKKKAAVSWKKLGSNYKYEVYYSAKKSSGFKKVTTTKSTKVTVSKLTKGKKYYFKVRGVRTDIPETSTSVSLYKTVYTKYSSVAASKAIK